MTWERFELTGAVEDYLQYKGISLKTNDLKAASIEGAAQNRREMEYGTVDYSDRHGAGSVPLR